MKKTKILLIILLLILSITILIVANYKNILYGMKINNNVYYENENQKIHILKRGENYWSIADKYNIDPRDLEIANPKIDYTKLELGQELNIYPDREFEFELSIEKAIKRSGNFQTYVLGEREADSIKIDYKITNNTEKVINYIVLELNLYSKNGDWYNNFYSEEISIFDKIYSDGNITKKIKQDTYGFTDDDIFIKLEVKEIRGKN